MPPGPHPHHRRRRGGPRARNRRLVAPDQWEVSARVERFIEPALLLTLSEGPSHGYDLAEQLAAVTGTERIDYGNLYRLLRGLEQEGIVTSEWNDELPGRSKRTYELTEAGRHLLAGWATSLRGINERISTFLERFEEGNQ